VSSTDDEPGVSPLRRHEQVDDVRLPRRHAFDKKF
jgi:hypothetical protein